MKRTLLALFVLVGLMGASTAHAAGAYDWIWELADEFGTPYGYNQAPPPSGVHLLGIDTADQLPRFIGLGAGLVYDAGTVVVTGIVMDSIDGLTAALAGKANASHTHSTSDINSLAGFVDNRFNNASSTFATSTRSLNTAFRPSTTNATFVSYTVDIAATLSLTTGQTGTVTLQYADDNAFTTNVVTVQSSANGNTGTLAIGLGLTQTTTASLTGVIPAGKWVRISTANTVGTPTFTYRTQQEVVLPHK